MFKCYECSFTTNSRRKLECHIDIHTQESSDEDEESVNEFLNQEPPTAIDLEKDIIFRLRYLMKMEKEKDIRYISILKDMAKDYKERWQNALEELKACHTQMSQNHLCKSCSLSLSSEDLNKSP
jgi:hypothetical protein